MTRSLLIALAIAASAAVAHAAEPPAANPPTKAGPDASPFEGMKYRLVGPFRGGRATGVAGVAGDPTTFYFGAAAGGLWKTTDAGITWKPLWDKFPEAAPTVGAVAVSRSDPKVVYVGTGETNIRGNVIGGNGVYKSTDAGKTWKAIGLKESGAVGRIVVDPADPNTVYVAALGHIFGPNPERGIFKSTDGGATWKKVLYVDDRTGGIDVAFDPSNPKVMYAGMWQAYRKPWIMESGGPGSGLYKSIDGGETWTRLSGGGLPEGVLGRINVAPTSNPNRIYAMIEAKKGGLYRSDDGGKTWALINDKNDYRQRAWYFNTVFADPKNPDTVYVLNTGFYKSTDAGKTFKSFRTRHGDNHELWIDPTDPRRMINGNDGGANISFNGGETWTTENNQPTAQIYHIAVDNQFPYRLYGDQQDNSSISVSTAGREGGVGIEDYEQVGGGESGFIIPDPTDPNIVYGGGYDAELTRYDRRTGEERQITPWPRNTMGWPADLLKYRFQWTAPILVSKHDPHALYFAANVLFKSTNQGQSWTVVSPDLTRNDKSKQASSGGPLTKDNTSVEYFDTIFAVSESPVQRDLIWAGSDDGLVHVTQDGGAHWTNVTPKAMPDWATVEAVEPDPHDTATAYVAADRHRLDDAAPYVFVTHDGGKSWSSIVTGIPSDAYVHVVRADPTRKGLLYAGTEKGVFVSWDEGGHWRPLQLNLPVTPVHDLALHGDSLAVATHGRAFWVLDDLTPVRQWGEAIASEKAHLFTPAAAYHTVFPGRGGGRESAAANPPAGVVFNYWLAPSFGTARPADDAKSEGDKKPDGSKKPEADPLDARIRLEIVDTDGKVVRSFPEAEPKTRPDPDAKGEPEGGEEDRGPRPAKLAHLAGLNSFVWDMRWPSAISIPRSPLWAGSVAGPKALPGRYTVRLIVDGQVQSAPFEILPDPRGVATQAQLKKQFDLHSAVNAQLNTVHQAVLDIREARLRIRTAAKAAEGKADAQALKAAAEAIDAKMTAVEEVLIQPRAHASEDALNYPVRLNNMLAALGALVGASDAEPTDQEVAMFTELKAETDKALDDWAKIKAGELAKFDAGK